MNQYIKENHKILIEGFTGLMIVIKHIHFISLLLTNCIIVMKILLNNIHIYSYYINIICDNRALTKIMTNVNVNDIVCIIIV